MINLLLGFSLIMNIERIISLEMNDINNGCSDINEICQEWEINGYCFNNDFVRLFCPQSCRVNGCYNEFNINYDDNMYKKWYQISNTMCDYNINTDIHYNNYFNIKMNIDIHECTNICQSNPFCKHAVFFKETNMKPLGILLKYNHKHWSLLPNKLNNICVQSYVSMLDCNPISLNDNIIDKIKMNYELKTPTIKELSLTSEIYQYIPKYYLIFPKRFKYILNKSILKKTYNSHELSIASNIVNSNQISDSNVHKRSINGKAPIKIQFKSIINNETFEISWVSHEGKEVHQGYINKTEKISRHSVEGHVFNIKNNKSKEIIGTYKCTRSHSNVHVVITPYGFCVSDEKSMNNNDDDILFELNDKRWHVGSKILDVYKEYVVMLLNQNNPSRYLIANVLNKMGEIYLYGSFDNKMDINAAWVYFSLSETLDSGDAMLNMGFMLENNLIPDHLTSVPMDVLKQNALFKYYCGSLTTVDNVRASLLLGFRSFYGVEDVPHSCEDSLEYYRNIATMVENQDRLIDRYIEERDLSKGPLPPDETFDLDTTQLNIF